MVILHHGGAIWTWCTRLWHQCTRLENSFFESLRHIFCRASAHKQDQHLFSAMNTNWVTRQNWQFHWWFVFSDEHESSCEFHWHLWKTDWNNVLSSAKIRRSQNVTLHLHIKTVLCPHLTQKLTSFVLINVHVRQVYHPINFYHSSLHPSSSSGKTKAKAKKTETVKSLQIMHSAIDESLWGCWTVLVIDGRW